MKSYIKNIVAFLSFMVMVSSCNLFEDLDVPNENSPNLAQAYADPQIYPNLLSGSYKTWWNESIGPNPNLALTTAAEIATSGYGSWGMGDYYKIPRQPINNIDASDIVLDPVSGAWYSYYSALSTANNVVKEIELNGKEVIIGENDYTQSSLAHAYFLQGLLIGHLGLLYDKAFLITEETDLVAFDYEFTEYPELIAYALEKIDKAIAISNQNTFTDPISMMPGVQFDNQSLSRFANANAARILASSARTLSETEALDWGRILNYAENGITEDFAVDAGPGWTGLAISRDPYSLVLLSGWDWLRVNQRLINMMAPNDPGAQYPWPQGVADLPEVTSPDKRLESDMEYVGQHPSWNPTSRGYQILSSYKYVRFFESFGLEGIGNFFFFLKAENDLLEAEAIIRTSGPNAEAADLINNTRVGRGELTPLSGAEDKEEMLAALFYERYVELGWTYPALGFYDRRRTDDLFPGTPKQFPIPAKELNLHGFEIYTFGGE